VNYNSIVESMDLQTTAMHFLDPRDPVSAAGILIQFTMTNLILSEHFFRQGLVFFELTCEHRHSVMGHRKATSYMMFVSIGKVVPEAVSAHNGRIMARHSTPIPSELLLVLA
jgi:hypothetical protein